MKPLINDRIEYWDVWWEKAAILLDQSGHIRTVVRSDGHGVFVANTLRRLGYTVRLFRHDPWFPYRHIEVIKAVKPT